MINTIRGRPSQVSVPPLRWVTLVGALLLLAFFGQAVTASVHQSLVIDEPVYIGAGYSSWVTGDWRLQTQLAHPPTVYMLNTFPLLLRPRMDVTALPGWEQPELTRLSRQVTPRLGPLEATAFAARAPNMLLALLMGALVFRWAADWFGWRAGLLALALWAFDPNLVAHAQFATTDVGVALFCLATFYGLSRFLRHPTWRAWLLCGGAAGLAVTAKSSGALALPALALAALTYHTLDTRRSLGVRWARAAWQVAAVLALVSLAVWCVYRFEVRPLTPGGLPIPAASYWQTIGVQQQHSTGGHQTFLMGRMSEQGWWYYYLVTLAVKTPLPTLILFGVSLVAGLARAVCGYAGKEAWQRASLLGTFPILFLTAAMWGHINLGYRLLLPMLSFIFVFIGGQIANRLASAAHCFSPAWQYRPIISPPHRFATRSLYFLCALLLAWYVIGTAVIWPHHLAYFNELAGGPDQGYKWLVDSNLDWGQWLLELSRYVKARGLAQVHVSQYGLDPVLYGINAMPLPPAPKAPPILPSRFDPAPGIYAIGATALQGLMMSEPDNYEWFRHQQPVDRLGHALFVYNVQPHQLAPTWVAQCAAPIAPLDDDMIVEGFGRSDLRQVEFDCTRGWLYPDYSSGWYVLPYTLTVPSLLDRTHLVYQQPEAKATMPFRVYFRPAAEPIPTPHSVQARVAPSNWPINEGWSRGVALAAPIQLKGPLAFIGFSLDHAAARPRDRIEIVTYWRVTGIPSEPISIMLHALNSAGQMEANGDGLAVPVSMWQVGDVIAQRHLITLPADAVLGMYWLQTGVYTLNGLERMPITQDGVTVGDRLILATLRVGP